LNIFYCPGSKNTYLKISSQLVLWGVKQDFTWFFYEGHAEKICQVLENILVDILNATDVPYANIEQCGNYQNHSLELAQKLARHLLESMDRWRQVV
jgi:S-ribosylhomocysteine lyase LuxS involved in autoinducer biosynthesis